MSVKQFLNMRPFTRTNVASNLDFPEFRTNHIANEFSSCGRGIILLARDCMAIPGASGSPRRGITFSELFLFGAGTLHLHPPLIAVT